MSDRLRRQIDATSLITPEEKHRFNEMLDEVGPETHLCHGDFHALNLMWDGEHLTIIDWMDASHGNPLMDTCRTYVIYLGIDQQIAEMYLDEYCRQSAQHRNDVLRWSSVIAGARLSERTENAQLLWDLIKLGLQ